MKNSAILWNMGTTCAYLARVLLLNRHFIIWLMRVSTVVFLFILISFQVLLAVPVSSQSMRDYKVSLKLEDESLLTGIKRIEEQSIFRFYYRKSEIKRITDLNIAFRTRTVENTLYELLKNTGFSFRQINNNILLKKQQQVAYMLKGRILTSDRKTVEFATIQINKATNSQLITSALADTAGRFNLKVYEQGDYLLKVFSPGTDSLILKVNVGDTSSLELPDIILKIKSIQLNGVTIRSRTPLLRRSTDKLTLNVEGSVYEKGEDALRLFNVIPGVRVEGKDILFRGSESVTVYVDNRKVMLQGDQLFAYLRSIPSESVKSYELRAVPGAEYDAQNGGVIINIVLKSEYRYGLSGNVSSSYWYNGSHNRMGSTFLNYRAGKLNVQGGFNYRRAPAFYEDSIIQEFKSTGIYSPQTEKYKEDYHSIGYNIGLDYNLNLQQTIGVSYNKFSNPGDISNLTTTNIDYLANAHTNSIDSSLYTSKDTRFRYTNQMTNVFYRNKLDTLGSKLDAGYSYIYYGLRDPSAIESQFLNVGGIESHPRDSLFTDTRGKSSVHVINIDFEKYFSKSWVLGAGGKYTNSKTDYSMDYRQGLSEQSSLDTLQSNRFLYNEHILAFYGTLAKSFDQWDIKIGLRTEQTNYNGLSITTGKTIGRNQWNLFPSAYVNRKIGADHSLTLSYSRRINRPGFRDLNPFITYTNLNNIWEGNPDLRPYFSDNLQLEYLWKNKYSITTGYQNTRNAIATNVTNVGDLIISKDENISDNNNVFMSVYIPLKLTNWWEFNTNATLRYTTIDIQSTPAVHRSKLSQNVWASSKFNLPGNYFMEISGSFSRNSFYGIYDQFNVAKMDLSVKKSFFGDRLTARLELQDPFHLYKPHYEINTPEFRRNVIRNKVDWARYAGIWLTYNFSKGKKKNNKDNIDAGGNEARGRL